MKSQRDVFMVMTSELSVNFLIYRHCTARCVVERVIERASFNTFDFRTGKKTRDIYSSPNGGGYLSSFFLNRCHVGVAFDENGVVFVPMLNSKEILC